MLDKLKEKYSDPEKKARLAWWFWIVSTAFMLFGFAVIFYIVVF